MADLQSIKEQLKEQSNLLWAQIQDHPAYSRFMEKFESLPKAAQKAVIGFSCVIFAYIFLSIPLAFFDSAGEQMASFEENRALVKELLKAASTDGSSDFQSGPNQSFLTSKVQRALEGEGLLESQIKSVEPFDATQLKLAPKSIESYGVEASLGNLNLNEIVNIGYKLQNISSGVKVIDLDVNATEKDPHFFDVTFRLVSFVLPKEESPKKNEKENKGRKRNRK